MKYIYTIYAWIVGAIVFTFISAVSSLILQFVKPKKYTPIFRAMMKFLLFALLIRVKVTGLEKIRDIDNYLYMPNHTSFLDPILLTAFFPKYTVAIEEKRNFSYPVYGWIIKAYGNISINRKSVMGSKRTFDEVRDRLKSSRNIVVFPEGGRTVTGKVKPFKKLLFRTAKEAEIPIMPVGMNGVFELNHKSSIWLSPSKITINFGDEITSEFIKESTIEDLSAKTRESILSLLDKKYW